MGLTAEFQLLSSKLELVDVARKVPDCTITIEYNDQTFDGPVVTVIHVVGQSLDVVETALEDAEYVQEFALISDDDLVRVYHIVIDGPWPADVDEHTLNKTFIERVRLVATTSFESPRGRDRTPNKRLPGVVPPPPTTAERLRSTPCLSR